MREAIASVEELLNKHNPPLFRALIAADDAQRTEWQQLLRELKQFSRMEARKVSPLAHLN
jgi:hypothetical protein